eukprot:PhF_6_TR40350/c2_g2_i1/m.60027
MTYIFVIISLLMYGCTSQDFTLLTVVGITQGFKDGPAATAKLIGPSGFMQLPNGTVLFADSDSGLAYSAIRAMDVSTGRVWTLAGGASGMSDSVGRSASFDLPRNVRMHSDGISVLITDMSNDVIRRLVLSTLAVSTIAGVLNSAGYADGVGSSAKFDSPTDLVVLSNGTVLIVDRGNYLIRGMASSSPWRVWTVAGTGTSGYNDAIGRSAKFSSSLEGIYQLSNGTVIIGDVGNRRIRGLDVTTSRVWSVAGDGLSGSIDGVGTSSRLSSPCNFIEVQTSAGPVVYFTDRGNYAIRALNMATGSVWTLIGGTAGYSDSPTPKMQGPFGILQLQNGSTLISDFNNYAIRLMIPALYNQDGNGFSGSLTTYNTLNDPITMTSQNQWPSGVTMPTGGAFAGGVSVVNNQYVLLVPHNMTRVV